MTNNQRFKSLDKSEIYERSHAQTIREMVYQKFDCRCAYCGEQIKLKDMQVDHVVPKSRFQSFIKNRWVPSFLKHLTEFDCDHLDNLFPACRVCNKWKNDWDLGMFKSEIQQQVKRLFDYSSNFRMAIRYNLIQETGNPVIFYFERGEKFS